MARKPLKSLARAQSHSRREKWVYARRMTRFSFAHITEALRGAPLRRSATRRAPVVRALPMRGVVDAIERCELRALFWARRDLFGRWRDPGFERLQSAVLRWLRLERLLERLKDHNWRVDRKREVLEDDEARAELREALGGDAAMMRWEAAWSAAEADAPEPEPEGCGLRGCDCVKCGGEFVGYDYDDAKAPTASPGIGRRRPNPRPEGLRAVFRLASTPRRVGSARDAGRRDRELRPHEATRTISDAHGDECASWRMFVRIPVWPSELRKRRRSASARGARANVRPTRRERECARVQQNPSHAAGLSAMEAGVQKPP